MLVAGEASGDLHAADLVAAMRRLLPGLEVTGIAGAGARSEGMTTLLDTSEVATMGLTEVAEKGRVLWRAYRRLRREIREDPPDLLVLIDFPEFNLALARVAKRAGVPVFYYVSPQVWAWRRGRVRKILRRVDRLAVVFPFEAEVYGRSEKVVYVGHPLLDRVRVTATPADTLARHGFSADRPLVTLLPGSRLREIEHLLPPMAGAAGLLATRRPLQFALALAPTLPRALAERLLGRAAGLIRLVESDTYNLISASALVLATSGTVTLETALLERPMVLMYRTSRLTYLVARMAVDVPAIGMPNLIAGRQIVPELLQGEVRPERIAAEAEAILADPERARKMSADLAAVRGSLGPRGAAERAARLAVELLR
ncbi:MAG: lipid-A-disaccharide synthase [Candidatus Binatia bacterium]